MPVHHIKHQIQKSKKKACLEAAAGYHIINFITVYKVRVMTQTAFMKEYWNKEQALQR